jgi:hypothetical protein
MRAPSTPLRTPYEQLKSLSQTETFLKTDVTFETLDVIAAAMSDSEAAHRLNEARAKLFQSFQPRSKHVASTRPPQPPCSDSYLDWN